MSEVDRWDGVDLAALLTLDPIGSDRFAIARNDRNSGGEIFGGQYLGQALSAAIATGNNRAPHAMHGFFLRAARADRPLEAQVERVRDGRSFSHRRVTMTQEGKTVFSAEVSLHDADPLGPTHEVSPPAVPPPESLRNFQQLLEDGGLTALGAQGTSPMTLKSSVEVKPVDARAGFTAPGQEPSSSVWLRALRFDSDHPHLPYAALAYLSDVWVNSASRMLHGQTLFSGETAGVSLNHCLWFHRKPSITNWLLYVLDSPCARGGTGFNRGSMFERGVLVASTAQEALLRLVHES